MHRSPGNGAFSTRWSIRGAGTENGLGGGEETAAEIETLEAAGAVPLVVDQEESWVRPMARRRDAELALRNARHLGRQKGDGRLEGQLDPAVPAETDGLRGPDEKIADETGQPVRLIVVRFEPPDG